MEYQSSRQNSHSTLHELKREKDLRKYGRALQYWRHVRLHEVHEIFMLVCSVYAASTFDWIIESKHLDVNVTGTHYKSPLHLAAEIGDVDIVHVLLKRGARVNFPKANERTKWENTPLHIAAREGQAQVCECILEHSNADVDARDFSMVNNTPLHAALQNKVLCDMCRAEVCRVLIRHGANLNAPMHLPRFVTSSNVPYVRVFAERVFGPMAKVHPLEYAMNEIVHKQNTRLIKLFLASGSGIKLHMTVFFGRTKADFYACTPCKTEGGQLIMNAIQEQIVRLAMSYVTVYNSPARQNRLFKERECTEKNVNLARRMYALALLAQIMLMP